LVFRELQHYRDTVFCPQRKAINNAQTACRFLVFTPQWRRTKETRCGIGAPDLPRCSNEFMIAAPQSRSSRSLRLRNSERPVPNSKPRWLLKIALGLRPYRRRSSITSAGNCTSVRFASRCKASVPPTVGANCTGCTPNTTAAAAMIRSRCGCVRRNVDRWWHSAPFCAPCCMRSVITSITTISISASLITPRAFSNASRACSAPSCSSLPKRLTSRPSRSRRW